jgi:hypothetical protein
VSKIIGGSAFGRGDSLIDTTDAVLLDETNVAVVGMLRRDGAETALALELGGRINHTQDRTSTLYLLNVDGAAGIISELLGLAERIDPGFLAHLLARIAELPREGND